MTTIITNGRPARREAMGDAPLILKPTKRTTPTTPDTATTATADSQQED